MIDLRQQKVTAGCAVTFKTYPVSLDTVGQILAFQVIR